MTTYWGNSIPSRAQSSAVTICGRDTPNRISSSLPMGDASRRDYVLLEGWSEIAAFGTITEGLLMQDIMERLFPNRKFDLHLKRDGFMRLREGCPVLDGNPCGRGEMIKLVKGGEVEHGGRSKDLPEDQGGRPGELSQGLSQ